MKDELRLCPIPVPQARGLAATGTLPPAERAHAVVHLGGNAIVADDRPRIAQADRLALDHEAPQRVAGVADEAGASRVLGAVAAVVLGQGSERRFQRASHPAERRDLLLRNFVVERVEARGART